MAPHDILDESLGDGSIDPRQVSRAVAQDNVIHHG
jgi:hypothetical protein